MEWSRVKEKLTASKCFMSESKVVADIPVPEIKVPHFTKEHPDAEGNYYGPHTGCQGGCFEGRYYYQSFLKYCYNDGEQYANSLHVNNKKCIVRIVKYDVEQGKVVGISKEIDCLNHINDMTYYPVKNQLVACNNRGNKNVISYLNADTLEYEGSQTLEYELYAIDYHAKTNRYILGISGTTRIVITDDTFAPLSEVVVDEEMRRDYTKQNICCDDTYIYCLYSGKRHAKDRYRIFVYTWEGEFVTMIRGQDLTCELENASIYEGALFVGGGMKLRIIQELHLEPEGEISDGNEMDVCNK